MPILHKKNKKKKQRQKEVELSNRGVSTFTDTNNELDTITRSHFGNSYNEQNLYETARDYGLDSYIPLSYKNTQSIAYSTAAAPDKKEAKKKWKLAPIFKLKECGGGGGLESSQLGLKSGERERGGDAAVFSGEGATPTTLRQEVLRHVVARRTLESEKADLTRHLAAKDSLICDMRKQLIQKEKSFHVQRTHFEEAIRNIQNGKPFRLLAGDSAGCRSMTSSQQHGGREELQLVREAICALRGNFRGTDPNQHTLDTLEQAISVLMERSSSSSSTMMMNGGGGGAGGGEFLNGGGNGGVKDKRASHAHCDSSTKVIYFTDRTVTPFMSNIAKPLGDVTLRDFKNLFDRPGCFRFHFKSHDPEYGLVKEEIMNDDDILPGVDGKIIAWVEEDIIE